MMEVLKPISEKYCDGKCPYGNLAKLIDYENHGCDIDYVSEKVGSPYVFTWEIYVGAEMRQRYVEKAEIQKKRANQTSTSLLDLQLFQQRRAATRRKKSLRSAAGRMQQPEDEELVDSCLEQFIPQSEEETGTVLQTWTSAYLELCERVHQKNAVPPAQHAGLLSSSMNLQLLGPDLETTSKEADSTSSGWPAFDALSLN